MNVTNSLASALSQPLATKAVAAPESTAVAEPIDPTEKAQKKPLFSGGLVNWEALMTPDTLSALFALNEKGEVQFNDYGAPILKEGELDDTVQEQMLTTHLIIQHRTQAGEDMGICPNVSDEQKQFFHSVTGYNLVVDGPLYSVRDDQGNPVSDGTNRETGGRVNAVWQLAGDLITNAIAPEGEQKPVDADWFAAFKEKMGMALGGSTLPSGWAAKADAYFDQALNSLFDKDRETSADRAEVRQDVRDRAARFEAAQVNGGADASQLAPTGSQVSVVA